MNANEIAEGINSPHNACCYKNKCLQQQFELTQWKALSNFESKTLEDCNTVIKNQQAEIAVYKEALEKLARLGNGDSYGNSIGNDIAIRALRKAQET